MNWGNSSRITWVTPYSWIALRKRSGSPRTGILSARPLERFIANDADRAQSDLGLASQPAAQLSGLLRVDPIEQRFLFPAKDSAGEELRQKSNAKEERDIEPGEKVEEENVAK